MDESIFPENAIQGAYGQDLATSENANKKFLALSYVIMIRFG